VTHGPHASSDGETHGPHASSDGVITWAPRFSALGLNGDPGSTPRLQYDFGYGHYACTNGYQSHQCLCPPSIFTLREVLYWAFGRKAQHHFVSSAPRFSFLYRCFSVPGTLLSHATKKRQAPTRSSLLYPVGRHNCPRTSSRALIPGRDHASSSGQY